MVLHRMPTGRFVAAMIFICCGGGCGSGGKPISLPFGPSKPVFRPDPASGEPSNPGRVLLSVPAIGQRGDNWCWAATGEMITTYLGRPVSQCEWAKKCLPFVAEPCDGRDARPSGDLPAWPDFGAFGLASTPSDDPLTWAQIRSELRDRQRPFAYAWKWDAVSGHIVPVVGYDDSTGTRQLIILNPLPRVHGQEAGHAPEVVAISRYQDVSEHWRTYWKIGENLAPPDPSIALSPAATPTPIARATITRDTSVARSPS